jgi:hypothetical protein
MSTFQCELPARAQSLATLRAEFADWLATFAPDSDDRLDLVLAMSEMATAALGGNDEIPTAEPLRARAWNEGDGVSVEVVADERVDAGDQPEPGLSVVASLTDAFGMRAERGAVRLRARKAWSDPAPSRGSDATRFSLRSRG